MRFFGINAQFALLSLVLAFCSPVLIAAQVQGSGDDIDSLFTDSGSGTVGVSQVGTGSSSVMDDLAKKRSLDFSLSLTSMVAGAFGWEGWPIAGNISDLDGAAGFGGILKASLDARPDASARIHGYAEYEIPTSTFRLKELFADKDFADTVFLRAGRQIIGWGRANIFKTCDLLGITDDSTAGDFAIKIFVPAGKAGVIAVAYYQPVLTPVFSVQNANAAMKFEYASGRTGIDLVGLLHGDGSAVVTTGAGTSVFGADMFIETRADVSGWMPSWKGATAGFIKEWSDPRLALTVEYRYKADALAGEIPAGHYTAVATGWKPKTQVPLKIALQWLHCQADGSGSLAALLRCTPFAGIDAELALPFSYGVSGSAYGLKLPANWDLPLSWEKRLSIILKVSTTISW